MNTQIISWQQQILDAAEHNNKLQIIGNATKFNSADDSIDKITTKNYSGIVEYRPEELVITVKAGTTLEELNQALAKNQQMLAFEPPDFGNSTIGGTVALALSGQTYPYYGGIRDFILGMDIINGKGKYCVFGGRVMKNVAGFDLSRLLTGSAGKMALITQLSFKLLPAPKYQCSYQIHATNDTIIKTMQQLQNADLSGLSYQNNILSYRISSNTKIIQQNNLIDNSFWADLKPPYFESDIVANMQNKFAKYTVDTVLLDFGGKRRWLKKTSDKISQPTLDAIKQKITNAFDPNNIFN